MLEDLLTIAKEHGIGLSFSLVLLWLLNKASDKHSEERKEWREDATKLSTETTSVVKENNQVIRELIRVIEVSNNRKD
jgi:hypothetical protein